MSPPSASPTPAAEATAMPAPPCLAAPPDQARWFKEEVHAHDGQLKSWLKGAYPDVRDIDDVVQESYLRIWKAKAARPIASAKSFLFTIARHLALDHLRRARISPVEFVGDLTALNVTEERATGLDLLAREEKLHLLADAIIELPERMREIVILHKIEGLPQIQVAERLGLCPKTVENLVGRGVQRCREFLRRRGIERF